jgi:hypothetical protein
MSHHLQQQQQLYQQLPHPTAVIDPLHQMLGLSACQYTTSSSLMAENCTVTAL